MPTLRIMSLYEDRKRTFAAELSQALADLRQYKAGLVARFGKENVDAISEKTDWTAEMIFGGDVTPDPFAEDLTVVRKLRTLERTVVAAQAEDPHPRLLVPRVARHRFRAQRHRIDLATRPREMHT